jgi:coenzyme F420 hydrogenase subunit delta
MLDQNIPEYCQKPTLILGCGSILRGDDGFGPRAIEHLLERYSIPANVAILDAGTGVGDILIDIALSPVKPKKIILVDALDRGVPAGMISVVPLSDLEKTEREYIFFHQGPTSKLLRELESLGVEVNVITVQPEPIPELLTVGLSTPVQNALAEVCEIIVYRYLNGTPV